MKKEKNYVACIAQRARVIYIILTVAPLQLDLTRVSSTTATAACSAQLKCSTQCCQVQVSDLMNDATDADEREYALESWFFIWAPL